MMEAKKKYEKPAFRLVTDLGSILECLYEVYGTDGTMLIAGNKLSDTVIYPFIRMIKKKCKAASTTFTGWMEPFPLPKRFLLGFSTSLPCLFQI